MTNDTTSSKKMLSLLADSDRPESVRLPKGSWLPFPRSPIFAMREAIMRALGGLIFPENDDQPAFPQPPVALVGPDGMGKTALALEFCYRAYPFFDGVQWIDARLNNSLLAEIAINGQSTNLPNWLNIIQEQARSTLQFWQTTRRLVVLDNLQEPEHLTELLKKLTGVQVLITARDDRWLIPNGVRVLGLGDLEEKESASLLRKTAPRLKKEKDPELQALCAFTAGSPLALSLAGYYLKENSRLSLPAYLERLQQVQAQSAAQEEQAGLAPIFTASMASLDSEKEAGRLARQVLDAAAYCAPDLRIPFDILRRAVRVADTGRNDFDRAVQELYRLGLLAQTQDGPLIHTLVAEQARRAGQEARLTLSGLADALVTFGQSSERRPLAETLLIRAHFEAALPHIEKAGLRQAGALWGILGYEYWMIGNHDRAKTCYQQACAADEKAFSPRDYRVAVHLYNLGRVQADNKELLAAQNSLIRSAEISADYKVATEFFNLGNLLVEDHERGAAKDCLERAAAIIERIYGPEYPLYATYISRLGEVLFDLDEYEQAKNLFTQVLANHEKAYSNRPNATQLAIDCSHLGHVLKRMGDLEGAKAYFERALAINENPLNYGRDHLQVARDANNLGRVLRALGDLEGARACFERVLKINEHTRGLDLSDVTKALINMGLTLRDLGEAEEAAPYFEKAMAIDEIVYSTTDSSVATDVHRLGIAMRAMGDLPKARACFERAVEIEERVHGPEHPNVATNLHHLARVLHEMKDLTAARACYERALAIDRKKYGPQHSYVATDINDLGFLLQDMGDLEGAKACFEQALVIDEKVHGPEHPNVARDLNNLASVQKAMGNLSGAVGSFARAAEIFEMFYGVDHPKAKIVRQNLESVRRRLRSKK